MASRDPQFGNTAPTASDLSCLSVLNHVSVGVYAVDLQGNCSQVNAAALKMLGFTEDECLGHNMHALMHYKRPDGTPYPAEECPIFQARITGHAVHDVEEVVWSKAGEPVYVLCSSVPIEDRGRIAGTVVTLNDVTARHAAEEELRRAEDVQREVMRQRDAAARIEQELANEQASRHREASVAVEKAAAEQLREQQKLAEERLVQSEKLAAVGRLAASISHEINNPLEAVTNLLYLVKSDQSLSKDACEYIHLAEQELGRVSEIVAQTLRFQRGSASPADCVPEALVESVIALHQGRLHNSRIRIDRQHRSSRPFRCAEGDVRQILNNLVSNAIDAMRETGGVITIRTAPGIDPQTGARGLRISIADTGHGMSRATAAQIFEPFYTTKGASGSGLGLWISNSIAKRHGGRLTVRSRKNEGKQRGTTFSLFLPQLAA